MEKKILIIEDDKMINEMYSMKFEKEWFNVVSAYDWLDWLSKVSGCNPDVVLLDIMTPWMNWFETLEVIKNQSSYDFKVVMFTNIADKDKIDQALQMWADEYLIKANTTPKEAVERVNALLQKDSIKKEEPDNSTSSDEIPYVKPGINKFKMKNPEGGKDIEVEIKIGL